jgi:predicted dehydrogenase
MKLAILGADRQTLAIARAIVADDSVQHDAYQLVACAETNSGPYAASFDAFRPVRGVVDNWEALLDTSWLDAVIVSYDADEDRRAEQLRKFAQVGVPTLVAHPLFISMLVYYELDMIRRESGTVMLPYLPERLHPAIGELMSRLATDQPGSIGRLEQTALERHLVQRDPAAIKAQFARDVDVLQCLAGDLTHLGAMAGGSKTSYESLNVQMSGPSGVLARWSVAPAADTDSARLILVAPGGRAVLAMPTEGGIWNLELEIAGQRADRQWPQWNGPRAALEQLRAAIAGQPVQLDWLDAARSIELTQTIDRSLARGRTIELHHEEYNEASAFKSTMAASGCGLLLAGLLLLLAIGVVEDLGRAVKLQLPLLAHWPYLLLAVLSLFLLLQLLLFLLRPGRKPKE